MNRRVWLVARREYLENVKTKAFLVGILLTPLLIAIGLVVPRLIDKKGGPDEVSIAVVDAGNGLADSLAAKADAHNREPDARPRFSIAAESVSPEALAEARDRAVARARARSVTGALVLEPGVVPGTGGVSYHSVHAGWWDVPKTLRNWLTEIVRERRMREKQVDPAVLAFVQKPVVVDEQVIGRSEARPEGAGGRKREVMGSLFAPMGFVLLLFIGIMTVAQGCLTSLIEEKSNRIVEVVLGSLSPFEFMTGKIVGMGLVGLTLLSVWGAGAYAAVQIGGVSDFVAPESLAFLLLYFVLGFFFYAALFCAVGSACNTLKEAQNLMAPISILLFLPWILAMPIARDPNGTFATAMSYVPPFTPFVMMNRLAASPPPSGAEVALSLAVLAGSVLLVMRAAGKIFRVGVLMYGKPPRPGELLRWMRTG